MTKVGSYKARQQQRLARERRKSTFRSLAFILIVVVVLGSSGFLLVNAFYKPPLPEAKNTIDISADMSGSGD